MHFSWSGEIEARKFIWHFEKAHTVVKGRHNVAVILVLRDSKCPILSVANSHRALSSYCIMIICFADEHYSSVYKVCTALTIMNSIQELIDIVKNNEIGNRNYIGPDSVPWCRVPFILSRRSCRLKRILSFDLETEPDSSKLPRFHERHHDHVNLFVSRDSHHIPKSEKPSIGMTAREVPYIGRITGSEDSHGEKTRLWMLPKFVVCVREFDDPCASALVA